MGLEIGNPNPLLYKRDAKGSGGPKFKPDFYSSSLCDSLTAPRTLSHAPSLMAVLEEAPKALLPSLLLITSLPPKFSFL